MIVRDSNTSPSHEPQRYGRVPATAPKQPSTIDVIKIRVTVIFLSVARRNDHFYPLIAIVGKLYFSKTFSNRPIFFWILPRAFA